jgi:peptide/nickel transport system permease protein
MRSGRVGSLLLRNPAALAGSAVLVVLTLAAILADRLALHDPVRQNLLLARQAPLGWPGGSLAYPAGTDGLGRDILSRIIYGARVSLAVGIGSVTIAGSVGVGLGLVAGYRGGWWDDVIMRLGDIQLAFPALVLAIALMAVLGAGLTNVILVLALTNWVTYARVVRGEVLSLRNREFVHAARLMGVPDARIMLRHILPNVVAPVIVVASFTVAQVIIAEATLSFLGIGVPPPTPSWGSMIAEGRQYLSSAWWIMTVPGLVLMAVLLAFNLVGDWLRDVLDPRLRRL